VEQRLRREKLQARMVLQVHDELVVEVPEEEREVVERLAVEEMEGVVTLAVPLKVDRGYGRNWDEAKG
jgi:DNA polymerase-1